MRLPTYPPSALSAFARLHQLQLNGTSISHISPEVGLGVLFHPEKYNPACPPLLTIGKDLILSAETVELAAKNDHWIRGLLRACCGLFEAESKENDGCGELGSIPGLNLGDGGGEDGGEKIQPWGRNPRLMIMLFLAVMMVRGSVEAEESNDQKRKAVGVGSGGIWSEYIKFLLDVSIPTTWAEEECALLRGTSLDLAVTSKKAALAHEFHCLQHLTSSIPWCKQYLWNLSSPSLFTLRDWAQIDAWFRSRVLELPGIGHCLIPYLDMVNHSDDAANAYYDLNEDGNIDLLPIDTDDGLLTIKETMEVRINYGPHKSSAELLFSYGFLNAHPPSCQWLSLPLPLSPLDPLTPAKEHILHSPPTVKLIDLASPPSIAWLSTEIWLLITNAEDGLEFKVLQQTNGSEELVLYWCDDGEVDGEEGVLIDDMDMLRRCLEKSDLWEVFHLRAIVTLQQVVADKLQQLDESEDIFTTIAESAKRSSIEGQTGIVEHQEEVREGVVALARELRERERRLLSKSITWFEGEKERLVKTEVVQGYLAKAQEGQDGQGGKGEDEEEDFS